MSEETGLIEKMARHFVHTRGAEIVASDEEWSQTVAHYHRMVAEYGASYSDARSLVNDAFRDARAALSAISAAGWAVVPKEPTDWKYNTPEGDAVAARRQPAYEIVCEQTNCADRGFDPKSCGKCAYCADIADAVIEGHQAATLAAAPQGGDEGL